MPRINLQHGGDIFAIAEARGWDWREVLDFSASINPLGPSPEVKRAIEAAIPAIVHYPSRDAARLVRHLGKHWEVDPARILPGNGATELIHFVARCWTDRRVAVRIPTFSEFHRAFPSATLLRSEEPGAHDIVIATNPNNPTGAPLESCANFIDESFIDFTGLRTAIHDESKWVLRSLTKFHALPGLRAGALAGPRKEISQLKRLREPWQVNVLAEAAAIASLEDKDHALQTRAYVAAESQRLYRTLTELAGWHPSRPIANYLFARLDYPAASLADYLLNYKVLVRICTGAPGIEGEAIRIAVKSREANDRLIELLFAFHAPTA